MSDFGLSSQHQFMQSEQQQAKKKESTTNICSGFLKNCDRDRIQTCNPHIRSVVLYSVELRSHCFVLRVQRYGIFSKLQRTDRKKFYLLNQAIAKQQIKAEQN